MYTRIVADILNSHECGIDCVPTPDGPHILYPALPTIDAGRYQWELNRGMTRAEYRASGQDETRECRVWARARAERADRDYCHECGRITRWADELCLSCGREWGYDSNPVADAARLKLYYSGRESSQDEGRGL